MIDFTVLTVVYGAFVVGLISPGPDLVLVTALSLNKGLRAAVLAALGIATGVGLWVFAAAAGLSTVIAEAPALWDGIRYVGGGVLIYMGSKSISACIRNTSEGEQQNSEAPASVKGVAPFLLGLMTNLANPKAAVVLVGLTAVLGQSHPGDVWLLVLGMPILTATWFTLVASVLSHQNIREKLVDHRRGLEGLTGIALAVVGIILIQSVSP